MCLLSLIRRSSCPFRMALLSLRAGVATSTTTKVSEGPATKFVGPPCRYFSSSFETVPVSKKLADKNLLQNINIEIKNLKPLREIPKGFPFSVHPCMTGAETATSDILTLKKEADDEVITIEVEMRQLIRAACGEEIVVNENDCSDETWGTTEDFDNYTPPRSDDFAEKDNRGGDDENLDEELLDQQIEDGFPMDIYITKGDLSLEFNVTASPINISIKKLMIMESHFANKGPHFSELDPQLKRALLRYLEVRGIEPSLVEILYKHARGVNKQDSVTWLEKLKKFVKA